MRLENLRRFLQRRPQQGETSRHRSSRLRYVPRADALEGRMLLSTITVTNVNDSGSGSLRQALINAKDGATIQFSPKLDGDTITLTSGPARHQQEPSDRWPGAGELTVSGGGTSGVFVITADSLNVTISGLTIADASAASGAAITNGNGTLTVTNDTFSSDQANGSATGVAGLGGAIYSPGGSLTVTGSTFTFDEAVGAAGAPGVSNTPFGQGGNGSDGLPAYGGAIYVAGGVAQINSSFFVDDQAVGGAGGAGGAGGTGGNGGNGGDAQGGALYLAGSAVSCRLAAALSSVTRPSAARAGSGEVPQFNTGGNGGNGGDGSGGGIFERQRRCPGHGEYFLGRSSDRRRRRCRGCGWLRRSGHRRQRRQCLRRRHGDPERQ